MIFAIIGLGIAFVLLVLFSNRKTRRCRWREDRTKDVDGARYYHCTACGAETFTKNGKPPGDCLDGVPKSSLPKP